MRNIITMFLAFFLMSAAFILSTGCYVNEEVVSPPPPPSYTPYEEGHWEWDGDEWEWED